MSTISAFQRDARPFSPPLAAPSRAQPLASAPASDAVQGPLLALVGPLLIGLTAAVVAWLSVSSFGH